MTKTIRPNHLMLVHGGPMTEGPITRLGIWDRFPSISKSRLIAVLALKTGLLIGILYFIHGIG